MPREKFEHDLQRLKDEILALGAMAERAVAESVQALKKRDIAKARTIMEDDRLVNEKRYAIENETLTLIATQQPMAGDLRTLAAIFEIATELVVVLLVAWLAFARRKDARRAAFATAGKP